MGGSTVPSRPWARLAYDYSGLGSRKEGEGSSSSSRPWLRLTDESSVLRSREEERGGGGRQHSSLPTLALASL